MIAVGCKLFVLKFKKNRKKLHFKATFHNYGTNKTYLRVFMCKIACIWIHFILKIL